MVHLMMVVEDESDFRVAAGLMDRAVAEETGAHWLREALLDTPQAARTWEGDGDRPFFDIHGLVDACNSRGVKLPQGHFNGRPGRSGAQSARNAFALARHLEKQGASIDAVLIVWDMDKHLATRKAALEQARSEAEADPRFKTRFKIVLGRPKAMMEAWILAGFDARDDEEHERLRQERERLGFSPVTRSHDLDATSNKEGASGQREEALAKKSAKRVLEALTSNAPDRIVKCWQETPLDTLRERGERNGLRDYLKEVREILLPLFDR